MSVYIKITDRNWIIEKLAAELGERLDYVDYGIDPAPPGTHACYYMTYSAFAAGEVAPKTLAFFTHLEEDEGARERFFDVAARVDHRICMADRYAALLTERGCGATTTIVPGTDLEQFEPRLRIGVVGRTYHTGRKGEALVRQVMDVPGIEWCFTGSGWPLPGLHVGQGELPAFYRSLDYVLVPARYEGGPMPVIEALACGTPVIAPDVGFVHRFPHVPYALNDAADLRRVLRECLDRKRTLRRSVEGCTWDAWAEGHDRVFAELDVRGRMRTTACGASPTTPPVELVLHGSERTTLGGPSLRVPRTAERLRDVGVDAAARFKGEPGARPGGIVHVHNAWAPQSALESLEAARASADRVVFSPIYLDLSELDGYQMKLPSLARAGSDAAGLRRGLRALRDGGWLGAGALERDREPVGGYHARVSRMLSLADHVICLSDVERRLLDRRGLDPERTSIVANPVDASRFTASAGGDAFRVERSLDRFVLCVGRIEPRKNQMLLAAACREIGVPLVLVGHVGDARYHEQVLRWGGGLVTHLDRLDPQDPTFLAAFAEADCFALPSFAEGAPLAALEAAACGSSMLLSDRSSEREYFGARATYCDPADLDSIALGLERALGRERPGESLRELVRTAHSWEGHVNALAEVYRSVARAPRAPSTATGARAPDVGSPASDDPPTPPSDDVIVDVTTTLHNASGKITGINRVEFELLRGLGERSHIVPACWANPLTGFVAVARGLRTEADVTRARVDLHGAPTVLGRPLAPRHGAHVVVAGSAWMQNVEYTDALVRLVRDHSLRLTLVVHDLVPVLYPHWYEAGYAARFERNLRALCEHASKLMCVSASTTADLGRFLDDPDDPRFGAFTHGSDLAPSADASSAEPVALPANLPSSGYVLAVGAIHPRKNYELLYSVWCELARRSETAVPPLVVVGGYSWQSAGLRHAVEHNPDIKGKWHVVSGIDDAQLAHLYRGCLFTIYPSLYEGWGLPVAESLAHGKVCLASDRSSIPEIADASLLPMLDPFDSKAWLAGVVALTRNRTDRESREAAIRERYEPPTWADAAATVARQLPEAFRAPVPATVFGGELLDLSRAEAGRILGRGWGRFESDGVHMVGAAAELAWDGRSVGCSADTGMWVEFGAYLPRSGLEQRVEVLQRGSVVDEWTITAPGRMLRRLSVDVSLGSLSLRIDSTVRPHLINGRGDMRQLGLKLHRLWIGDGRVAALELFGHPDRVGGSGFRPGSGLLPESGRRPVDPVIGRTGIAAEGVALAVVADETDLRCRLALRASGAESAPLRAVVEFNGTALGEVSLRGDDVGHVEVVVPRHVVRRSQPLRVRALPAHETGTPPASSSSLGLLELTADTGLPWRAYPFAGEPERDLAASGTVPAEDDLARALRSGWYEPEQDGAWAFSDKVLVGLPSLADPGDRIAELGVGWLRGACPVVDVRAGGESVDWRMTRHAGAGGRLQVRVAQTDREIEIVTAAPVSPRSLGLSSDARALGIRLGSLSCVTLPERGRFRVTDGWHEAEPAGRWTRERVARLVWCLGENDGVDGREDADDARARTGRALVTVLGREARRVEIVVDGRVATSLDVPPNELTELRFSLPAEETGWNGAGSKDRPPIFHDVEFRTGTPSSPAELGLSSDPRPLGLCLHALEECEPGIEHGSRPAHAHPVAA